MPIQNFNAGDPLDVAVLNSLVTQVNKNEPMYVEMHMDGSVYNDPFNLIDSREYLGASETYYGVKINFTENRFINSPLVMITQAGQMASNYVGSLTISGVNSSSFTVSSFGMRRDNNVLGMGNRPFNITIIDRG